MTIRVLLVDDEPLVRGGLRAILEAEDDLTVVAEAGDGAEALTQAKLTPPDVVLMDVRMPHVDGIAATRLLAELDPPPRVIVVTTFENDDYVYDALVAGAQGFLLKREAPDQVVHAVRTVHRSESLLFPAAVRALVSGRARGRTSTTTDPTARLTEREQEVLRLVAAGMSNAEVAGQLFLGIETVKSHVRSILTKLGVRDRVQAVIVAYESGFVSPH